MHLGSTLARARMRTTSITRHHATRRTVDHAAIPAVALALYATLVVLAGPVRVWLQRRRTGDSGQRRVGAARLATGVPTLAIGVLAPAAELRGLRPLPVLDHPPLRIGGLVLAGVGVTALSASQLAMGDAWRIGIDPAERTALITTGPFGYVRNPIYSANLAVGLGLTLAVPNPFSVAGLAVLVAGTELYVRRVEEPHLARVHSAQWRRYASDVGRFVPTVGRLLDDAHRPGYVVGV